LKRLKYIPGILLLDSVILMAGYLLSSKTVILNGFSDIAILTLLFSAITFISLLVFDRGLKKEPGSQTMHLFVAIVVKMLLEMFLVLLWFFILKKTDTSTLISFFVLYLAFTLYIIILMLNTLKRKILQ
jgi:hypothetical protein